MSEVKVPAPDTATAVKNTVERSEYLRRRTFGELLRGDLGFLPVLLTLLVVVVYFQITSGGYFLHAENLSDLSQQIAETGIIGLGAILVLLLGEIDLSMASVAVLCAVVMAVLTERLHQPAYIAIPAALLTGALIGAINGFFVAVLRVPAFIVTLAGSIGYAGLLLAILYPQDTLIIREPFVVALAGSATSFLPDIYGVGLPLLAVLLYVISLLYMRERRRKMDLRVEPLGNLLLKTGIPVVLVAGAVVAFEGYHGIPYSTAIFIGLVLLFWIILTKTSFGRHVYAVGGNIEAARRAGINVISLRIGVFVLCSTLAAVGGIIGASRENAVASAVSSTLLLQAIGAAVIGGVSLFGGRGSVWAIVLGALVIGALQNGLTLNSQPTSTIQMVEGTVLLLAVTVDAVVRRAQRRSGR